MGKKIRVHLTIKGLVQGVCFRLETRKTAKRADVFGWVKNIANGDVEALIEGEEEAINDLVKWCHHGPSFSRVDTVLIQKQEYKGEFNNFEITY